MEECWELRCEERAATESRFAQDFPWRCQRQWDLLIGKVPSLAPIPVKEDVQPFLRMSFTTVLPLPLHLRQVVVFTLLPCFALSVHGPLKSDWLSLLLS